MALKKPGILDQSLIVTQMTIGQQRRLFSDHVLNPLTTSSVVMSVDIGPLSMTDC